LSKNVLANPISNSAGQIKKTSRCKQPETNNLRIQAFFLGSFRVLVNNRAVKNWPSKKGRSIFAYILLNHKKKIPKDILMDIFWKDYSPESARNNLNVAICGLRKTLKAVDKNSNHILLEEDFYLLNAEMSVWVDFEEFVKHHKDGCHYEREGNLIEAIREYELSEGLYHGDFYPGSLESILF
jgi:DNA-binding SARP family transcriptional activator